MRNFPDWLINKWQGIADLIADLLVVKAALIMKIDNEFLEVFLSSKSAANPYHVGQKEKWFGLYCETVIKTQQELLIPNALKDKNWDNNPDIKLGMIAYLGFPINFPDNQPFGTLCVLDDKERQFSPKDEQLLLQFKSVIELDLALNQFFELKTGQQARIIERQVRRLQGIYAVSEIVAKANGSLSETLQAIVNLLSTGWHYPEITSLKIVHDGIEFKSPNFGETAFLQSVEIKVGQKTVGTIDAFFSQETPDFDDEAFLEEQKKLLLEIARQTGILIERQNAEALLRDNEKLFYSAFTDSPLLMSISEAATGKYLDVNDSFCSISEFSRDEVIGKTSIDLAWISPDDRERLMQTLQQHGKVTGLELALRSKSGKTVICTYSGSLIKTNEGVKLFLAAEDITKRKQVEERLNTNLSLLRMAEQNAKLGGWSVLLDSKRVIWSDEVAAIHETAPGFSPSVEEGINFYAPEWRDRITKVFTDCIQNGIPYNEELEIITTSGKRVWVTTNGEAVRDEKGRIVKIQGAFQDISQRKRAEQDLRESESRFRSLVELAPYAIFIQIREQFSFINQADLRLFGAANENQLIGQPVLDRFPPSFREQVLKRIEKLNLQHERVPMVEETIIKLDGSYLETEISAIPYYYNGEHGALVFLHDISQHKRAEAKLRDSERFTKSILDSLIAHIAVLDEHGVIIAVNEAWKKFARENDSPDPDAYLGTNYLTACIPAIIQGDPIADQVDLGIRSVLSGLRSRFRAEYSCDSPTQARWFSITVVPQHEYQQGVIVIHQDITDRKQAQQLLEATQLILNNNLILEQQLARTDQLTGVNNRRYLFEIAEHEFEIAERYQQPLSVVMFDIDHFKKFNDTFGHKLGDQILNMVTQVAAKELRAVDAIGRYGGEEFIILLPMTNAVQAFQLAERIRIAVAAISVPTEKGHTSVTISIGVVEKGNQSPSESVEDVFHRADLAMYAAKQAGRNRTRVID